MLVSWTPAYHVLPAKAPAVTQRANQRFALTALQARIWTHTHAITQIDAHARYIGMSHALTALCVSIPGTHRNACRWIQLTPAFALVLSWFTAKAHVCYSESAEAIRPFGASVQRLSVD